MQDPGMFELYDLVEKLNAEADKAVKYIEVIRSKGHSTIRKAESVLTSSIQQEYKTKAKEAVLQLTEHLVEVNCHLELADDESPNLVIPYISTGNISLELKFLAGDNPWNFWLVDENVDVKTIHKNLLKKYQNNLLDPYPRPKPSDSVCFLDRNKVFRGIVLQAINENRVKVIDCDSNVSKVVTSDKLFKVDPDACCTHASALKCTISKEIGGSELWSTDLRDIFCNALKEAVLDVRPLERMPGSHPSYLVDLELRNEDEDCNGNLKKWILGRLMPELRKLTCDNDSVIDFLSSEALDPYYQDTLGDDLISEGGQEEVHQVQQSATSASELLNDGDQNNLNSNIDKVKSKIVANMGHAVNKSDESESCEEDLVSSSEEVTSSEVKENNCNVDSEAENNQLSHHSGEFKPFQPQWAPTPNIRPKNQGHPVPGNFQQRFCPPYLPPQSHYHQPVPYQVQQGPYGRPVPPQPQPHYQGHYQGFPLVQGGCGWNNLPPPPGYHQWPPQQFPYNMRMPPPNMPPNRNIPPNQNPVPYQNHQPNKNHPSSPKPWSSGESDTTHSGSENQETDESVKVANINNINVNVNVMAPEFVPKKSKGSQKDSEEKSITDSNEADRSSPMLALPRHEETLHVELKKPISLLKPGENFYVLISHVENPSEFYVHFITKNNQYLDELLTDMFEYYTTKNEAVDFWSWKEAKRVLGKFCACKWLEDNHWYRVEVLKYNEGEKGNNVKVFSVDFGNVDCVPLSCLQPLHPQFTKMAMCAQPCHLAQVRPLTPGSWSEKAVEFFQSKVVPSNSEIYSVTVVPSKESTVKTNSLSVLLYKGSEAKSKQSINELMVECGLVASTRRLHSRVQSSESDIYFSMDDGSSQMSDVTTTSSEHRVDKQLPSTGPAEQAAENTDTDAEDVWERWDPRLDDFESARNNPAIDTDDAVVAVSGYAPKDDARICKFYAKEGYCWKQYCSKEHSKPNRDGVTTDKEEVYTRAIAEMALPLAGEVIPVRVTSVISVSLFYVQLRETRGMDMDSDDDFAETLSLLTENMNTPKSVQNMKYLEAPPALGQLVLSKWEGFWYRARVIGVADSELEVMFVDFGSTCSVKEIDLRAMQPEFLHLPFQAIECCLANIVPPETDSPRFSEASELLKAYIESCVLTAKVYNSGDGPEDSMQLCVTLQTEEGLDVGEYLVGNGVCLADPNDFYS